MRNKDYICRKQGNTCERAPMDGILVTYQSPPHSNGGLGSFRNRRSNFKLLSVLQGAKRGRGLTRVQHPERKKTDELKRFKKATAKGERTLLEDNVRHMTELLIILGKDAKIRVTNLGTVMDNLNCA